MIIYGLAMSPFVRKVLVVAAEKGIEVQLKPVALGSADPEFIAASPFSKMPALRDGDFTLADSSAIVQYFEALRPEPAMFPADARGRGKTAWYEEFADTNLFMAIAPIYFNRIVAPFLGREGDHAAADKAQATALPPVLDWLEGELTGDFLVGDAVTLAELAVASPLVNLSYLGNVFDPRRYPGIARFQARIWERPSFALPLDRERKMLAR